MAHHIETIQPNERLAPSLGGTGYLTRSQPATPAALIADLKHAAETAPAIGASIWKVWRGGSTQQPRRLTLDNGKRLACKVGGGTREWWFVSVNVAAGLRALEAEAPSTGSKLPRKTRTKK